ncbi:MAG: octanoyltransferase [Betaproteobacteria bacterium RBG_16_66_20]|nr:MAG: octanoyltransferase [Betaproteobacteria bacterium RBG_16_66_20]
MAAVIERVRVVHLGLSPYESTLKAMREFTSNRNADSADELWLLEHPPVYTRGLAAAAGFGPKADNGIPVIQVERGGEITYHGPGQVVLYTLVDLARRGIKVKQFVAMLEQSVIDLLGSRAERKPGAPGVYVAGAKVAALGIRVTRGCAFHGLALNVDMDLAPFEAIDPCGQPGLRVTQTRDLGFEFSVDAAGAQLAALLIERIEHA